MNEGDANDFLTRSAKAAGGVALGKACATVSDALIPGTGYAAAEASTFLPQRAKDGAAPGAVRGVGVVGKAIMAGIAAPALLPAVAIGAAIMGIGNLLFGKRN